MQSSAALKKENDVDGSIGPQTDLGKAETGAPSSIAQREDGLERVQPDNDGATDKEIETILSGYQEPLVAEMLEQQDDEPVQIDFNPNQHLDRLLELEASDDKDWEIVHKSDSIRILKTNRTDSPVVLIKVYVQLPGIPADKAYRMISDVEVRKTWDNVLSSMRIFGKVNESVDHMYSVYKAPIGISDRDFCQRRTRATDYRGVPYMIHFTSVSHPECPSRVGVVRAHTHISGYIIRRHKTAASGSEMTILTQTDIRGQVPKFMVNLAAAKTPASWCTNFKTSAERLMGQGKI